MDAELRSLVQKFQALQKQEVLCRINERNVIEILNVIHKKQKLVDILYTSDGKEFLTWAQLRHEIASEVHVNSGRMNIVDLPAALNVDMTCIERALPQVLEDDAALKLYMGELMTQSYLDSIVADAAEALKELGYVSLSEFAKSHRLGSVFVGELLAKAIQQGNLAAHLTDNAVYTRAFVHAQLSALRCALLARTRPVNINDVAQRRSINTGLMESLMVQLALELPGVIEGAVYTPSFFTAQRDAEVTNLYRSNGVVSYAALSRLGITNPSRHMETLCNPPNTVHSPTSDKKVRGAKSGKKAPESSQVETVKASEDFPFAGHVLSQCFLADKSVAALAVPLESLSGGDVSYVDLADHLPNSVDLTVDADTILRRLAEVFPGVKAFTYIQPSLLLAAGTLDRLKVSLTAVITEEVRAWRAQQRAAVSSPTLTKGKAKSADVEVRPYNPTASKQVQACVARECKLSEDVYHAELQELLSTWSAELFDIANWVANSDAQSATVDAKRARAEHLRKCSDQWADLCVAMRGVEWAEKEFLQADQHAIQRTILQTKCAALARDIFIEEARDLSKEIREKIEDVPASAAALRSSVALFDKKKQPALASIADALNDKSVGKFCSLLETLCSGGEIAQSSFHALNKKAERELAALQRDRAIDDVRTIAFSSDAAEAAKYFSMCCTALIATRHRVLLNVPGKATAAVCAYLAGDQREASAVERARAVIVGTLASNASTISDVGVCLLEEFRLSVLAEASGSAKTE